MQAEDRCDLQSEYGKFLMEFNMKILDRCESFLEVLVLFLMLVSANPIFEMLEST